MNLITKALKTLAQESELASLGSSNPDATDPKAGDTLVMTGPLGLAMHKALNISHAKTDETAIAVESQANDAILAAQMRLAQPENSTPVDDQGTVLVYHGSVKDNTQDNPSAVDVFQDIVKQTDMNDPTKFVFYSDHTLPEAFKPPGGSDSGYQLTRFSPVDVKAQVGSGLAIESVRVLVKLKKV
jgi:hypothetical protein